MIPQDVMVVRRGGERIPCELALLGVDEDGIEHWAVATLLEVGDELWVGFMPAGTTIVAPIADDVDVARRLG